ncbi:membrane or secreted protein [Formosa undariae]|uniref:Membrane or secreted protein n=1 Tax=Formosa undariae TaxID=1325436 RepID=A0ABV5EZX3_9FLAO
MKTYIGLLICFCLSFTTQAQHIIGAWESQTTNKKGAPLKHVVVYTAGYYVFTSFDANTGQFVQTSGGSWVLDGDVLSKTIEFDATHPEQVGTALSDTITLTATELKNVEHEVTFTRIDNGTPGKLQGAWLMSGRVKDGTVQARDTSGSRKTMKILSGTRFQWIAYDIETKAFKGTGGGTYTTENGKYTENIEFFSKDQTKVGLSLTFNFKLEDGDWHHSGKSSKGDPIHEIWSLRD